MTPTRSQYGAKKIKIYLFGMIFATRRFFGSLIMYPNLKFKNSEWQIQYGGLKCKRLFDSNKIWYAGVFGVALYESKLKIQKFEMADPKWRTKIKKLSD